LIKQGFVHTIIIAVALAFLIAFAGCGKKGDPIPSKAPSQGANYSDGVRH